MLPSAQGLSEQPFRPLPGGSLRKFPRRLGQFPLSFSAEPRRVPAPSARSLSAACAALPVEGRWVRGEERAASTGPEVSRKSRRRPGTP
jgi:hypothetical protein